MDHNQEPMVRGAGLASADCSCRQAHQGSVQSLPLLLCPVPSKRSLLCLLQCPSATPVPQRLLHQCCPSWCPDALQTQLPAPAHVQIADKKLLPIMSAPHWGQVQWQNQTAGEKRVEPYRTAVWDLLRITQKELFPDDLCHKKPLWVLAHCVLQLSCELALCKWCSSEPVRCLSQARGPASSHLCQMLSAATLCMQVGVEAAGLTLG